MSGTKPMVISSQCSHPKEEKVQGFDGEKSSRGIMTRAHMFMSDQGRSLLSETPVRSSRGKENGQPSKVGRGTEVEPEKSAGQLVWK